MRGFPERRPPPRMPFSVPSSTLWQLPPRRAGDGLRMCSALQSILRTKLAAGERMRITAVAGAGKSTALREYARANPNMQTLYLTFNRSVKRDQAAAYARENGLDHVEVRTLGSIAYEATKSVHEGVVADDVDVQGALPAAPARTVRAVRATLEAFFASADDVIGRDHVDTTSATSFGAGAGDVVRLASTIWSQLCASDRTCIDGGILAHTTSSLEKLFQLKFAADMTGYDLVLLDEAHDCTRAEIAAVFAMPGAAVVVYDARQCINQWRYAADTAFLESLPCKASYQLTNSLRYGDMMATKIGAYVDRIWKRKQGMGLRGNDSKTTSYEAYDTLPLEAAIATGTKTAVLGLTNTSLVVAAFRCVERNPRLLRQICFASGGPFAHVAADGAEVPRELVAFAAGEPVSIPFLQTLSKSLNPMAALRCNARFSTTRPAMTKKSDDDDDELCDDGDGEDFDFDGDVFDEDADDDSSGEAIDWRAALRLYDELGARRLCDAVEALKGASSGTATIEFITVHKAKGCQWPWVALLDDFVIPPVRHALKTTDQYNQIASNLTYVAMTRVQSRLFLRPSTARLM